MKAVDRSSVKQFQVGVIVLLLLTSIISVYSSKAPDGGPSADYNPAVRIAELETRLVNESSGIAASRRNEGIFWTHNDSGDGAFLYAFDRQGKHRGIYQVTGAEAQDWEDMAAWKDPKSGRSYLYIGDIGNNSKKRTFVTVYRIPEPEVPTNSPAVDKKSAAPTAAAESVKLRYPDAAYDAETLMVHPQTGDLYIVTKVMGGAARVFTLRAPFARRQEATLTQVAEIQLPNTLKGFLTGGAISPDGRRVALCDYFSAYELTLPGRRGGAFDEIWKQPLQSVSILTRKQGEAICYSADGRALLATSEGTPCPLIEITRQTP